MRPSESLKIAGKPIAYYPKLAKPLGSVNASILFSHFFYWHDKTQHELGIYRTAEEIELETGLTVQEQRTARDKLKKRGVLIETEKRIEHRIYYKLNLDAFDDLMLQHSGNAESTAPKCNINSPELQNQHSGSEESTAVIRTEDLTVDLTEDLTVNTYLSAEAETERPVVAKATSKATKHEADLALLAEHGITGQIAEDFLTIRKAKRQPLTETAMRLIASEAQKVGMTAFQAVMFSIGNGWGSFRADWVRNKTFGKQSAGGLTHNMTADVLDGKEYGDQPTTDF
nr:MAG TPA: FaeA-like protein [Caudoviricetes sp.]